MTLPKEAADSGIVFYHYDFSPYSHKIKWYLDLRGIPYAQCMQPLIPPRPDITDRLGVQYRRIPILLNNSDLILDTRLILQKLEELFPASASHRSLCAVTDPSASSEAKIIERLIDRYVTDAGIFGRAAQCMPPELPALKDPRFLKDRSEFMGRSWTPEAQNRGRPEGLVHLRDMFDLLETTILSDSRSWLLGNQEQEGPRLADIEAAWVMDFALSLPGAVPEGLISKELFPRVFAWIERFRAAAKRAGEVMKEQHKIFTIGGDQALQMTERSRPIDDKRSREIDPHDPTGLKHADEVELHPTDTGFLQKTQGRLIKLTAKEVVISKKAANGREIWIHAPRWGFRVQKKAQTDGKL